jgi:hypothetical protein
MATFEIKSEMNSLRFSVIEPGTPALRRAAATCTKGKGSGVSQADAQVSTGGHYLITLTYKGASCVVEQ